MDWMNQHHYKIYTAESNLQIQYNPYQNTNSIAYGIRKKS